MARGVGDESLCRISRIRDIAVAAGRGVQYPIGTGGKQGRQLSLRPNPELFLGQNLYGEILPLRIASTKPPGPNC